MVEGKRKSGYVVELNSGRHSFLSDVTEPFGGHDEGPGPHAILESALAACTVITVQMYADRHKMKLDSTHVTVSIDSEGKDGTKITRKVQFLGNLDEKEKATLLSIANKCPIHKILVGNVTIDTQLAP